MTKNVSFFGETYCPHLQGREGCNRFLINIRMSVPENTGNVRRMQHCGALADHSYNVDTTMHSVCVVKLHVTVNYIMNVAKQ